MVAWPPKDEVAEPEYPPPPPPPPPVFKTWREYYTWEDEEFPRFSRRRVPWVDQFMDVTADGQWHIRDDVARAAAKLVPPGVAWRKSEYQRRHSTIRRKRKLLTPEEFAEWEQLPDEEKFKRSPGRDPGENQTIRSGQRFVVLDAIHSNKRFVHTEVDGVVFVRRIPMTGRYRDSLATAERWAARLEGRRPLRSDEMDRAHRDRVRAKFREDFGLD